VRLHENRIAAGYRFAPYRKDGVLVPRMVFVNSMSDLHHEAIGDAFRDKVFAAMEANRRTIFQILTKRPGPMRRYLRARYGESGQVPANIWLGVSIENNAVAKRVDVLRAIKESHRVACAFLSVEPLIGPIDRCDLSGMDWVLIGGESGPNCRPMQLGWLRSALGKSKAAGAAIWFKQFGHPKNNPSAVAIANQEQVTIAQAYRSAVERGLEIVPTEKGGATLEGRTCRQLPAAWHRARDELAAAAR
jgi:protein gp37